MAMLDLATFRSEFPEMDNMPDALVSAKLADAHLYFDEDLFGDLYLSAVKYQAAMLIAASPFGADLRIAKGSPETLYHESLRMIESKIPSTTLVVP